MTKQPKRTYWTAHDITEAKAQARSQITNWRSNLTSDLVLINVLDQITLHNKSSDSNSSLNCFIFYISALVHHEKFGGLPRRRLDEIRELAGAILRAAGKGLKNSPLASLQSDLHIVQSQIFRKLGDHWSAAWEQHFVLRVAGDSLSGGIAFYKYVMGNRLMRMGHSGLALMHYAAAEQESGGPCLSVEQIERIKINKITINRISGRLAEARYQINEAIDGRNSKAFAMQLAWEEACCDVQINGDAREIGNMVKRGKPHHSPGYLVEATLWGLSLRTRKDIKDGPNLDSLRRNKKLKIRDLGVLFEIVANIQQGYNHTIPLEHACCKYAH